MHVRSIDGLFEGRRVHAFCLVPNVFGVIFTCSQSIYHCGMLRKTRDIYLFHSSISLWSHDNVFSSSHGWDVHFLIIFFKFTIQYYIVYIFHFSSKKHLIFCRIKYYLNYFSYNYNNVMKTSFSIIRRSYDTGFSAMHKDSSLFSQMEGIWPTIANKKRPTVLLSTYILYNIALKR